MKGVQTLDEEVVTGFERLCESRPDKTAIIYLGEKYSYAKLKEMIDKFASALYELGIRDNDKVMIYLPNSPQWVIAYFGAQKIGAVPVPVSSIYTPHEISYMINDSGAETIVCQDTNFGYVHEVLPNTCLQRVIVSNIADTVPWWKRSVGRFFDRIPHGAVREEKGIYFFRELMHKSPGTLPEVKINPRNHLAYILYTGGTTGFPKGVPGTHSGMVSYVKDYYDVIEGFVSEGEDTFLLVNPLFHIMAKGMFMGVALTMGNPTVVMPAPEADAVLEAIRKYKVSLLLGVPTLYRMILENDRLELYDLSTLKYCWSGGDVLPGGVFDRWRELTGKSIYQVYGSTEVGHLSLSPMDKEPTPTSVGKPFPSREVKVVNSDTLEEVPRGETGELLVTSDFMLDYWNKPEETANSFVELDGRKWYRMGDYVGQDSDGELYYMDRNADVIKYKAYRVSCSEIEAVLQSHDAVIDSAVVGVPDEKVGERIKAMVVLKEDAKGVGTGELTRWCRDRLAPYKVPQYIEFRDMLPKSKVGKLLRRDIREEERRRISNKKA